MSLFFRWNEFASRSRGLTFDDVLLVPKKSEIKSRLEPDVSAALTANLKLDIPLISANMDTITESAMALAMREAGGLGILHRFMSIETQVEMVRELRKKSAVAAASIGVQNDDIERAQKLVDAGCTILTLDIAHGHSVRMFAILEKIKSLFPDVQVIAGNVATPQGTAELFEAGADVVKVGIGPGAMCTTRLITGCGVPQLTAVALCAQIALEKKKSIIADGGFKSSGDIVKALAAGAQAVMIGSMLSGTLETPGEVKGGKKLYRGMASKSAQVSWRGGVPQGMAAEGESVFVSIKGPVGELLQEIVGGIRSGMSYLNASNLLELRENAEFIEMTGSGFSESRAHGMREY